MNRSQLSNKFHLITPSLRAEGYGPLRRKADVRIIEIRRPAVNNGPHKSDWLILEKREEFQLDPTLGDAHQAKLCIFYWDLSIETSEGDVPNGEFSAYYDKGRNAISVTASSLDTGGYVRIDPPRLRGTRLGTYLMNEVVVWARRWPDAHVREIHLLTGDAGEANRARRNRFYEQFGIRFDYEADDEAVGVSRPMLASELTEVATWEATIVEHNLVSFLRHSAAKADENSTDLRIHERNFRELSDRLHSASSRPIRWMFARLLTDDPVKSIFWFGVAAALAVCIYRAVME